MEAVEINGALDAETRIPKEAKRILHFIASDWNDVADEKALEVVQLKGGMTNEVYQIKWQTESGVLPRKVLVRIYREGVEIFFDREVDIRTFECMSKHGQGPRLLGQFPNGRIEEFIHARTLSAADLRDVEISSLIAAKLWEFHDLDMPGDRKVQIWDRIRNWLSSAKRLCPSEEAKEFRLDTIDEEIAILEKKLSGANQKIGFCHNDLQHGNIMIDEETRSVTIIDYEYASYNPVAFDIANHFCEMAIDYHTETQDINKYPDFEERRRFVYNYLNSSGNEPSDLEVEQLVGDAEKYPALSHLQGGLWGLISVHVNDIDFGYMEYARQRLQQYELGKQALLSCGNP